MTTTIMSEPPLTSETPQPPAGDIGEVQRAAGRESWRSEELLGERNEVLIVHGSEVYRLRRTRQDKLILYK